MRVYTDCPGGTVDRVRGLRKNASTPERRLLRALRTALPDLKWRHQAPLGPYFIDIMCFSERLVIEVDGETHVVDSDARRDGFVARQGYRTLRFTNEEVITNLDGVLSRIDGVTNAKGSAA